MRFQDLSRQVRLEKLMPLLNIRLRIRRISFFGEENRFETRSISDFPVWGVCVCVAHPHEFILMSLSYIGIYNIYIYIDISASTTVKFKQDIHTYTNVAQNRSK